ncbi:LuxR C-terminal-related transcriptional regulator [Pseudomonas sp.]|uniref:LuxR C-terminal-related transcriptional regulator n=1 Tax=Pseudomonas sp. TaxID=306 RepID=UPI003BB5BAD2
MPPTSPLITTRFSPPRISSHAVLREGLLSRLQAAKGCRLTLINGGAGFGKTTLMAQWRQSLIKEGNSIVWLSLAQEDEALESFCANLIRALQHTGVPLEDDLLLLIERESLDGLLALASVMINTLARASTPLYVMIDDFHVASDPRISRLVQILVDGAPSQLHVVLASRVNPSLKLGRLRAMAELCEVNVSDLGFNFNESLAFLKAYLDDDINMELAHTIHDSTDGWPIGLQLMSISLKANPRKKVKINRLLPDNTGLRDYLTEDVVDGLPPEIIEFLERISILRRFNADLAAHVSQIPQAADLIASIEARNLFILPVDMESQQQWYRLHPLFADFLQQRLTASGTDLQPLHLRAAQWLEQAGLVNEATRHAVLSENLDELVRLLERNQASHHSLSHLGHFMRWLDCVPLEQLSQHPNVLLRGAWGCLLTMLTSKAEAWIDVLAKSTHDKVTWAPHINLLRAAIALHHDDLARCRELLQGLPERAFDHPFNEQMRACLHINCLVYFGQQQQAWEYLHAPESGALRTSHDELPLMIVATAAYGVLLSGNVLEASRHLIDALLLAESHHGRRSVSACTCAVAVAEAHYEMDRIDDAHEALSNRLDLLRFAPPSVTIGAMINAARISYLQESPASALTYLTQKAVELRARGFDRALAHNLTEQVRILLGNGDWRQCESQRAGLDALTHRHSGGTPEAQEISALAALSRARICLARQEPDRAILASDIMEQFAKRYCRGKWRIQSTLLRAVALHDLGRQAESSALLRDAVSESYRLGLVRTILDEGPSVLALLANLDCKDDPVLDSFRSRLAATPLDCASTGPASTRATTDTAAGEASLFTKRELEIIDLLEQSMSNKRMAKALSLSQETIKWNFKNIYAKLGVSSRYEALVAVRQRTKQ